MHVIKCEQCQNNARIQPSPSHDFHSIVSPCPFSIWAINFIGKLNPISRDGHKFIIIATKYFTKWVEAIPMKSIKGGKIIDFLVEYIISRYGVPSKLFIDNGPRFKGNEIEYFCAKYHIERKFSSPYYPQGNVNPKHLTNSLKVSYPKLQQSMVNIDMNNSLLHCGPIGILLELL